MSSKPLENDQFQAPLIPSPNPWTASVSQNAFSDMESSKSSPSQSPFQLGSETPTLASATPPRVRAESIEATTHEPPAYSPLSASPSGVQLQLPTPSPSASASSSPRARSISPGLLESAASSAHLNVDLGLFAPGISRETTTSMADSFVTANSPGTDFRSLPATEPTSPFTETSFLSAEDDDLTISSIASSDDLAFVPPSQEHDFSPDPEDSAEDPFEDPFLGFTPMRNSVIPAPTSPAPASTVGSDSDWGHILGSASSNGGSERGHRDDDNSSEGSSDESWQQIGSSPTSPRI